MMKNLSTMTKAYILGIVLLALLPVAWMVTRLDWTNAGIYILAALGAAAQTIKVEGPNNRTNYSIAWFVYGFAFVVYGLEAAIFVVVIAHLVEWAWHKYPWYIQIFNIGNHVLSVFMAGVVFDAMTQGARILGPSYGLALVTANLIFVLMNHFLVGMVVKLARGQSFAESGVFEFLTLFLDFTLLSMGSVTASIWLNNPLASLLNMLPLFLLYQALRVPALQRQLLEMKKNGALSGQGTGGD
jgi:hypothetical protein